MKTTGLRHDGLGISQPATPPSEPESVDSEPPVFVPRRRDPGLLFQRLENHRRNQHAGARKTRRANNTQALQTLVEDEMEEIGEPSISDLQPNTQNAFTKLFNDYNSMRVWQYFITQDEIQQKEYLEAIRPKNRNHAKTLSGFSFTQVPVNVDNPDEEKLSDAEGFTIVSPVTDCRCVHPACNEEQRFGLMESQIQSLLKKKHMPLGVLSYLEEEVVELFTADPSTVYITQELTSFERLLVHALCQYNFLSSKSTTIASVRRTKVENGRGCFHAPRVSLTRYIETYYRAK
ncbi:R3H domain-containing protein 4 isoform X2 [Procambarus clarkii]|uniref:R3H domain-containing protein 4 isoform X2 n=1 Tax=Procambarus clarkii TaxID=6728 RepID=UPI001E67701E|nr:R3H domain-containing protein 4-like isoform X2 [Procambarus clarkii]XP_045583601.1 R3H domain-containing protein 4-like isoform X2 [Procambarus clarkii]